MKADWIKYKPGLCFFFEERRPLLRSILNGTNDVMPFVTATIFIIIGRYTQLSFIDGWFFIPIGRCVGVLHVVWTLLDIKELLSGTRLRERGFPLFERNGWWLWKKCTINFDNTAKAEINTVDAVRERFNDSGGRQRFRTSVMSFG